MRNDGSSFSDVHQACRRRLALTLAIATVVLAGRGVAANTIYVTTTTQKISSTDGCSLQEAIYSANFDNNMAIDSTNPDHFIPTECAAGSGDDTIELPADAVLQMGSIVADAHSPFGPAATPIVFSTITIEANGARLEHVANGLNFRAFSVGTASVNTPSGTVSGTGHLTIRNVHIRSFKVKGGDGASGGGGGMGAGGAIYVDGSGGSGGNTLTIENSSFEGNGATGGDGSGFYTSIGGGGGGLAGNGGQPAAHHGGGGGGSRGDGGDADNEGGGGGGTVTDGSSPTGGFDCGGNGGIDGS